MPMTRSQSTNIDTQLPQLIQMMQDMKEKMETGQEETKTPQEETRNEIITAIATENEIEEIFTVV